MLSAACAIEPRRASILRATVDLRLRQAPAARAAQRRPGDIQIGEGDGEIPVGHERLLDETVEHRVVVEPPPVVARGELNDADRMRLDKWSLCRRRDLGRGKSGSGGGTGRQRE